MKTVALRNLGLFGNRAFRYCYARALCEQNGYELRTEPWQGEALFTLDGATHARPDGSEDIVIDEYRQAQKDLIYTRADCRRWFEFRPEVERAAAGVTVPMIAAHRRVGDYAGAGYPVISEVAYRNAVFDAGFKLDKLVFVTEENAVRSGYFDSIGAPFMPDFIAMMRADVLFRGNSSFSWWASVLGDAETWAPVITGLEGGREHDEVPFVKGNHPRLCELGFVTDLHLKEA